MTNIRRTPSHQIWRGNGEACNTKNTVPTVRRRDGSDAPQQWTSFSFNASVSVAAVEP